MWVTALVKIEMRIKSLILRVKNQEPNQIVRYDLYSQNKITCKSVKQIN